jgi:peptidyl-prolyl cis-trans isomerase B (cyclophilin B)
MKYLYQNYTVIILVLIFLNCQKKPSLKLPEVEKRQKVEMITDKGTIIIELYNETPLHRDNFIELAQKGIYDSVLFHRVIDQFMIQSGDPDSKNAQPGDTLGNGGLGYTIDAEFRPDLFHKKGVLAAARDGNPERASSGTQFYIVQGKVFNDSLLYRAEVRINDWLGQHYFKKDPDHKDLVNAWQKAMESEDMERYELYNDSIINLAKGYQKYQKYVIPEAHRQVYKTLGGTPHLDQNYTVFGEVTGGFEVIDSIAIQETDALNRPLSDIRILSVRVLD